MKRICLLAAVTALLMIVVMVPSGRSDRFAVDRDAPWTVTHEERFLPGVWGPAVINAVSPDGAWAWGRDDDHPDQPACYWDTSTPDWTRTCPELEPGEAIPLRFGGFAWSPVDDAVVTTSYMQADGMRYVERLVRIELATGKVTALYQPKPGTYIPQLAFSPEGGQVAFVQITADGPITIQRLAIDGGEPETIMTASETVTLSDAAGLNWTAADQLVFFSGPYATEEQGYVRVNSDGSDVARIEAVTPGESRTRIHDVSADGRYMIVEGVTETEACGRDFASASSYVVDLERDEIAQVVCAVYEVNTPDGRGASLFATTRATVTSAPAFLPDGSIVVLAEQRAKGQFATATTGLSVIDLDSGRFSVIGNDLDRDDGLWDVSSELDDGSVSVWAGGYWRIEYTLAPAGD